MAETPEPLSAQAYPNAARAAMAAWSAAHSDAERLDAVEAVICGLTQHPALEEVHAQYMAWLGRGAGGALPVGAVVPPLPGWRRFLEEPTRPEVAAVAVGALAFVLGYLAHPTPQP